ncbi:MAG: hypothetical protein QNI84_14890 [Henriciella sp.]|nr:hypothetical protein [Henriciella sp.]
MVKLNLITMLCMALFLIANCAKATEPATKKDKIPPASDIDFAELLRASDPVEVCATYLEDELQRTLGSDFVSPDTILNGCQCQRDMMKFQLEQIAPENPGFHELFIQISMNFDVIPHVFNDELHPGGMEVFLEFLDTNGEREFGVSTEEFMSFLKRSDAITSKYRNAATALETVLQIPSCAESMELYQKRFPDVALEDIGAHSERRFALQRLRYDPHVSLTKLDAIMSNESLSQSCRMIERSAIEPRTATERDFCHICDLETQCLTMLDGLEGHANELEGEQVQLIKKLGIAGLYMADSASTAKVEDIWHYYSERGEIDSISFDLFLHVFGYDDGKRQARPGIKHSDGS